MNDFEQRLKSQSLKTPPAEWREKILETARQQSIVANEDSPSARQDTRPTWMEIARSWLWPHPGAWATLAAVWLLIYGLHNQVQTEIAQEIELAGSKGDPARMLAATEERRKAVDVFLATGEFQLAVADRPKRIPSRDSAPPLMLFTS